MLMIFIGPLLSQAMPMDHSTSMSMSHNMDTAAPGCHQPDHASAHEQRSGELHALWEKCGYCSLFFHCPALPQALSLITCEAAGPSACLTASPLQGHAGQAVFPGARTRAPPLPLHV
ncbi:hypothetical protein D3C76_354790 [compost metagenome]